MSPVLIGIVSGIVAAVIPCVVVYFLLSQAMERKLHHYTEALLQYEYRLGNTQTKEIEGLRGKMEHLDQGIGNLERSLTNVKTRGICGEWQLGAILSDLLRPEQYERECMVVPGSMRRVEYAVKMPGSAGHTVYLPIDSKFPLDAYIQLLDAREEKDQEIIQDAKDLFCSRINRFAKDIHDKYINPPYTTDFAVMFLPFESVYFEVLQSGVMENLMHKYRVSVAGPSSLAAILNSLQVGFQSVVLSEKTEEIRQALSGAGEEIKKFDHMLANVKHRLDQADRELEQLAGVRMRSLRKKLEYFDTEE